MPRSSDYPPNSHWSTQDFDENGFRMTMHCVAVFMSDLERPLQRGFSRETIGCRGGP
jgi:hypothetical protein